MKWMWRKRKRKIKVIVYISFKIYTIFLHLSQDFSLPNQSQDLDLNDCFGGHI